MGPSHSKFCTIVVGGAIKTAMATSGHAFCNQESTALIEAVCPEILETVKAREAEEDDDEFPQEDENEFSASEGEGEGGE